MYPESDLRQAFVEVQAAFPFEGYLTGVAYRTLRSIVRNLETILPEFQGRRLLDIGCGPMDKTGVFQKLGFECCAVDDLGDPWHKRDDNAQKIKDYAQRLGIHFFHQKEGDYSIPFEPGSFDVVMSLAVIEHLHESPRHLLNAMGTMARPGGLLVITMPNSVNLRKRLAVLAGRTNYVSVDQYYHSIGTWRGHVREYTLGELAYICGRSGFEVARLATFEPVAQERLRFPLRELYLFCGYVVPALRGGVMAICRKPPSWQPVPDDAVAFRESLARSVPRGVA